MAMESRALRFVESKQDFNDDPRQYNQPNLHTGRRVPPGFYNVRNLLKEERKNNKDYDEAWKAAEKKLEEKKKALGPEYFLEKIAPECYIALIAYASDGTTFQLYRDFNEKFRKLRGKSSWEQFPFKSLYYLLKCARHGIPKQSKGHLYRGLQGVHISVEVGEDFYFHCFTSCSVDPKAAGEFMGSDGTMVVIQDGAELTMDIAPFSAFDGHEVLVFPQNKFKIVSFEKKGPVDVLVIRNVEDAAQ